MRNVITLVILTFAVPACSAADLEPFEHAINKGLEYLRQSQAKDGSWSAGKQGKDPAVTALCTMAYLSAGHVPGEGKYAAVVDAGIQHVLSCQMKSGLFIAGGITRSAFEMYGHGICTLMLAECVGMMPDERSARQLREAVEKGVKVILQGQRKTGPDRGGWRYGVAGTDADLSVSGWQLMALRAARNIGCDVPGDVIAEALEYIKRCHDVQSGGYRYQPNNQVTAACTGAAILSIEIGGKASHMAAESVKAGSFLLRPENTPNPRAVHYYYTVYYSTQALFQLGENFWELQRVNLHKSLVGHNLQQGNGAWTGQAADDSLFGSNYCTAMAILALTVEYRLLPIYQRGEDK